MAVKLGGIIFVLSIKLRDINLTLTIGVLVGIIFALLLKKPYTSGKISRCQHCFINGNTAKCHLHTTIKSY